MEKTCSTCSKSKPVSQFSRNPSTKDGYRNRCKDCDNARRAKQRGSNTEPCDYETYLSLQDGKCAICGSSEPNAVDPRRTRFCLDHDHHTGRIRGLLCCNCNRAIGLLHDDVNLLEKATAYLREQGRL